NYTSATDTITINVDPKPLAATGIRPNDKVYDSTVAATLNIANVALVGVVGGDAVTLTNTSSPTLIAYLSGVKYPNAMVFDASGNLYVANGGVNTVTKYAPGSTTPSATLTGL